MSSNDRVFEPTARKQTRRIVAADPPLGIGIDPHVVEPAARDTHLFVGVVDGEHHAVDADLLHRRVELASVKMAAGRQVEVASEIKARPVLRGTAYLTLALLVEPVLEARQQEWQPFTQMPDDHLKAWIGIEQPAQDQAHGMAARFVAEAPGRTDQLWIAPHDALLRGKRLARVETNGNVQRVRLGPELAHRRIVEIARVVAHIGIAVDQRAFEAEFHHGALQLHRRGRRILQRNGGEGRKRSGWPRTIAPSSSLALRASFTAASRSASYCTPGDVSDRMENSMPERFISVRCVDVSSNLRSMSLERATPLRPCSPLAFQLLLFISVETCTSSAILAIHGSIPSA